MSPVPAKPDAHGLAIEGGRPVRSPSDFLVFGAPPIEEAEIQEVVGCLRRRWIGTGPLVARFQREFAEFKGGRFAVAVNSCTAALHLSMLASGVGPGDEVITSPMTFCATVNAILHTGATPVLADCDRRSFNILPESIEQEITPRTRAILVVHFAGRPCDMDAICEIAQRNDLLLIEDCAHAVEAEYRGRPSGSFGRMGCFSFYSTKNIVTGEGGMVLTDDEETADQIKVLAAHGMSEDAWDRFSDEGYRHYEVVRPGFKYNMMDIQAAMGVHQLSRVERCWQRRRAIWEEYQSRLVDLPCILPPEPESHTRHGHHLYTPLIDIDELGRSRDWVLEALTAENIGVGVHYVPIHLHAYYSKHMGWQKGQFPNAEWVGERTVSIPLSPALTDRDVDDVCAALRKVLGAGR